MDVVLVLLRHIEVDHHLDVIYIYATGKNVGGYYHMGLTRLEIKHDIVALRLVEIGMHLGDPVS